MADAPRDTGFYDTAYGHFSDELYAAIRQAAFGEDIGQNSWLTADELRTFCEWLGVDTSTELLEVASGSGGPALFTVETTGCRLFGVDLHDEGVAAANRAAQERGLADRARFVCVDARKTLPVDAGSFDAVICIDSINHMYERSAVLREWRRVLRPSGRVLFTDPITDSIAELGRWPLAATMCWPRPPASGLGRGTHGAQTATHAAESGTRSGVQK